MRLESVGKVLAERTLDIETNGEPVAVKIRIGMPRRIPDSPDFYCPYQIVGLADDTVRYTEGVDAAQAIYLAMEGAGTILASTAEARSGRLTWYGERAHGFPVREQRPHLRLVASN